MLVCRFPHDQQPGTFALVDVGGSALPPSLQILLDEGLYTRMKQLSGLMSKAEGFTPRHLIGKPEACFAIINTSLDWKLNPHFVARHTTPSSKCPQAGPAIGRPSRRYRNRRPKHLHGSVRFDFPPWGYSSLQTAEIVRHTGPQAVRAATKVTADLRVSN